MFSDIRVVSILIGCMPKLLAWCQRFNDHRRNCHLKVLPAAVNLIGMRTAKVDADVWGKASYGVDEEAAALLADLGTDPFEGAGRVQDHKFHELICCSHHIFSAWLPSSQGAGQVGTAVWQHTPQGVCCWLWHWQLSD
jgi:hypothetical protein